MTVWKYDKSDINTDMLFPGKYTYTVRDPKEMAQFALEDHDPTFVTEVQPNDIIVAGKNWGCGSSREQAVTCLKMIGLGAIVAESFARIYYRNCLNAALPAISCPDAIHSVQDGERAEVDLEAGEFRTAGGVFNFQPLHPMVMEIFEAGGLIPYTQLKLLKRTP